MKNQNLIFIELGLGVAYYLYTKKSNGLKDGDLIRSSKPDVYVMLNGLASPVTYDWIVRNERSFNEVKVLADDIVDKINKGALQS